MDVPVVRHGIAMDRDEAASRGMLDRDRPLTPRGRWRVKRAARGIAKLAPGVVALAASPFRRALETAEILEKAYGGIEPTETKALLPDSDPEDLAHFLAESASESPVAVVGHEPHLGSWVSWCLTGTSLRIVDLRKGGACLLRFEDAPGPGKGRLIWLIPPTALRRF